MIPNGSFVDIVAPNRVWFGKTRKVPYERRVPRVRPGSEPQKAGAVSVISCFRIGLRKVASGPHPAYFFTSWLVLCVGGVRHGVLIHSCPNRNTKSVAWQWRAAVPASVSAGSFTSFHIAQLILSPGVPFHTCLRGWGSPQPRHGLASGRHGVVF